MGGNELAVPDAVITFKVRVDEGVADGTIITDTAVVTIGAPGVLGYLPKKSEYSLTAATKILAPNVSPSIKTVDRTEAPRGATLLYTIVLSNTGGAEAPNVTLIDTIPNGTTYVVDSVTGGATFIPDVGGGHIAWIGTLGARGVVTSEATITFKVTVDDDVPFGTVITNRALVSSPDGNYELTAETTVTKYKTYLPIIFKNYTVP
jgi:uncharacterized repeat protein (TIGR01451 family)